MFKVGVPVFRDDFIDRKEELRLLKFYLTECQNQSVMIHAPRRFGKTSLIKEAFRIIKSKNTYLLYFDCKHYSSLQYLTRDILAEFYELLGISKFWESFKNGVIGFLRNLKPKLSVSLYEVVELSVEPIEKMFHEKDQVVSFLESLELLQQMAHAMDIQIKIALDEFQDIYSLTTDKSILDKLRATIQHSNNLAFIFCGSHESLMSYIFLDKRSAFFHFTRIIALGPLDKQELVVYVTKKFATIQVSIDIEALSFMLDQLNCHPYYSMKAMQILHGIVLLEAIKHVERTHFNRALNAAYEETRSYIDDIINYVKVKSHHFDMLISIAKNTDTTLDPLNGYRVKQSLVNMGLVKSVSRGVYAIIDPFLQKYLMDID